MRTASSREGLKEEYKSTCKKVKELVRITRSEYEKKIIAESKNNPKLIYTYINNQRKTKDKIKAFVNDEGELVVNKKGITNLLNQKFQEAFNKDNGEELPTFESRCETKCELSMSSFSSSNILSYLNIEEIMWQRWCQPICSPKMCK